MGELRLSAIAIDDLRDLFTRNPAAEERLRQLAASAYPPTPPPKRGLLDRLGPMIRPDRPVIRPGVPTGNDIADLLAAREVHPDRLPAAWALVKLWLADRSWSQLVLPLDEIQLDDLDFDLATHGVGAEFGLRKLLDERLGVPLKAVPGQVTGYVRNGHARQLRTAWAPAVHELAPENAELAKRLVAWLDGYEEWTDRAVERHLPPPDLVAILKLR